MTEEPPDEAQLKRVVSAPMLSLYGAGTILGAGIYVLVGEIAGLAGFWTPLAFLIAAIVAGVTGFVYAELSSRQPGAGGPMVFANAAFGRRWLAIAIGWAIVATGLISAATIIAGFVSYLGVFVEVPGWIVAIIAAGSLGTIAAIGVRQSTWFMALTTTAGIIGLFIVIIAGVGHIGDLPERFRQAPPLGDLATISTLLAAAFLAFYAYIGFEDIVHMSEEARRPERDLPIAITVALIVSAILYVLTATAALTLLDPEELAGSTAPLVDAVSSAGWPRWPLGILSLAVIINGALAQIVMASRVIYSLAGQRGAPRWLGALNRRTGTPLLATAIFSAIVALLAATTPIASLASATSLIMLTIFFVSNLSLIVLDRRGGPAPFNVPRWVPWVGALFCLALAGGQFILPGGG